MPFHFILDVLSLKPGQPAERAFFGRERRIILEGPDHTFRPTEEGTLHTGIELLGEPFERDDKIVPQVVELDNDAVGR